MTKIASSPFDDPNKLGTETGASVWWLGQAGFLIAMGGIRVIIDPYLSDSLAEKYRGKLFPHTRMMPPPIQPDRLTNIDWLLCTHAHTDHMDPGTIPSLMAANPAARALVPRAEASKAVERGVPEERLVLIDAGETVDLGHGVFCTATPSAHEDLKRNEAGYLYLGYVLSDENTSIWHSGDTIPWSGLADWLKPFQLDLALLPVNGRDALRAQNGVPGNLTLEEAVELADDIGARAMIGHHFGMFDFNTLNAEDGTRRLSHLTPRADVELAKLHTRYDIAPIKHRATSILFVCRGNICRSPTAEGIFRKMRPDLVVESAAIMDWNVGKPPHKDSIAVAADNQIDLTGMTARQITIADFDTFDFILAMDHENLAALEAQKPPGSKSKLGLLGHFHQPGSDPTILDPWGHDRSVFEAVFAQIEENCRQLSGLLDAGSRHKN